MTLRLAAYRGCVSTLLTKTPPITKVPLGSMVMKTRLLVTGSGCSDPPCKAEILVPLPGSRAAVLCLWLPAPSPSPQCHWLAGTSSLRLIFCLLTRCIRAGGHTTTALHSRPTGAASLMAFQFSPLGPVPVVLPFAWLPASTAGIPSSLRTPPSCTVLDKPVWKIPNNTPASTCEKRCAPGQHTAGRVSANLQAGVAC